MTALSSVVAVEHRNVRATNLVDSIDDPGALSAYSPGGHIIDATRRLLAGTQDGPRSRAWSITGPYGAGKSTFGVFLQGLLSATSTPTAAVAIGALRGADPQLAELLDRERTRLHLDDRGVIAAVAVCDREPILRALSRALVAGFDRWTVGRAGRRPKSLKDLESAIEQGTETTTLLIAALDAAASRAPVVFVVDELGKALEFAADGTTEADLYVLQLIAERFGSAPQFDGGILTLQHLSFEDYLTSSADARRREWRKVHGRFEDVAFVADRTHALRLLARTISLQGRTGRKRIASIAAAAETEVSAGIDGTELPSVTTGAPDALYPLHPLTALTLPLLASRIGQHDRSLVAFLASDTPSGLPAFLGREEINTGRPVPFIRLHDLYDFFFSDGVADLNGTEGQRLREIQSRIDSGSKLPELDQQILKAVAVLNLTAGRDGLRANRDLVGAAVVGPETDEDGLHTVKVALERLEERSFLTFRDFADEYRVWEGSDFDITGQVAAARERLTSDDPIEVLIRAATRAAPPRAAVAQRHSQERHTLRYFETRFARPEDVEAPVPELHGADGLILRVFADHPVPDHLPETCLDGRPLIVVWSQDRQRLLHLALDAEAATRVLADAPELGTDIVARRELRHRAATTQSALAAQIKAAFLPSTAKVQTIIAGETTDTGTQAAFSAELSDLCDIRYPETPVIRNETLNRHELTSQGAKARRVLIDRMLSAPGEPQLGIAGYGPERAMYEAVLSHTGIHAERHGQLSIGPPNDHSELAGVWRATMAFLDDATGSPVPFDELYRVLQAPPYGLKAGPIPVLLAAALAYRNEDVFVYQDGSFEPTISAALFERLLKAPGRFSLKRASLIGLRASVFDELRDVVSIGGNAPPAGTRNARTLQVVRPLMAFAGRLPDYTRGTSRVSPRARAVNAALLAATEPDSLLFRELPAACEVEAIDGAIGDEQNADLFVHRLRAVLAELGGTYQRLLDRIRELLREAFIDRAVTTDLREDLRSRSRHLVTNVIDPKLRSFLLTAADEGLDDDEWVEALAMTLTAKPPTAWTDHDLVLFESLLAERSSWFLRLELLHFEMAQRRGTGFDARRVTLTAPNGNEHHELVAIDTPSHGIAAQAADQAIEQLAKALPGQDPTKELLAVLVERLLTPPADRLTKESRSSDADRNSRKASA